MDSNGLEVITIAKVVQDIREAKEWYREQQKRLDDRFAKDVKASINRLQENPLKYVVTLRNSFLHE